jgi:H+/Cl- antiporter ClcA
MSDLIQPNEALPNGIYISPRIWAMGIAAGIGTGIVGGLLMRLLHLAQHVAFAYHHGTYLGAVAMVSTHRRLASLVLAGLFAAAVAWLRTVRPFAGEAGLNEAILKNHGRLPFFPAMLQAVESMILVGMGVSVGREGAVKQAGAALASPLAGYFKLGDAERRMLVAVAAGAGMGVAYNVPLGGALLAAEVFLGTLSLPVVVLAIVVSSIATGTSWLLIPMEITYTTPKFELHARDVVFALLLGPAMGLLSLLWVKAIGWAKQQKPEGWKRYAAPIAVFTALGFTAMRFPDLLGNGKGLVQMSLTTSPALHLVAALLVLKFIATAMCLATGTPGGLFTPTMSLGALGGCLLGRVWAMGVPGSDIGIYTLIGSAAMLAASAQGPVSAMVMVMELTGHTVPLITPALLAIAGSIITANWVTRRFTATGKPASIYSE